jgi:transcriptional regulator with XRE-family HTH domain
MDIAGFAVRLRESRLRLRLSRKRIAAQLGCDVRTLARWERGDFEPNVATIAKLAAIYGVSAHYLITGETEAENGNAA